MGLQVGYREHDLDLAWVAVRQLLQPLGGSIRLIQSTLDPAVGGARLSELAAQTGGAEEIERSILLSEVLGLLSPDEQAIVLWRRAGYSSAEIARARGSSVDAVDKMFSRAKQKVRRALGVEGTAVERRSPGPPPSDVAGERSRTPGDDTETDDGEI